MFKEVSLEVKSRNDLLAASKMNGATLSVAVCWPLNREEMVMILDITGPPDTVKRTITTLQCMGGVREAMEEESSPQSARVFMALEKPRICGSAKNSEIVCLDCPFNSTQVPARWRFTTRKMNDVEDIVAGLAKGGIQARIQDITPLDKNITLTLEEKGMIAVAIERGYFEFPRRITLEDLSKIAGVEAASLSKVLRSVE